MTQASVESVTLLALSAVVLWDSSQIMTQVQSGKAGLAGGYELLLGAVLASLALIYWLRSRRASMDPSIHWRAEQGIRWVIIGAGILIVYIFMMPFLGYMLSTILVFAAYMRVYSPYGWLLTVAASCAVGVSTAWLWSSLAILLPQGFVPWP